MEIPTHFDPRGYQREFLDTIRGRRIAVLKWARRAGKGLTTFAYAITRMVEEPMGVVIIYPTKEQGYDSFWNNVENDGFRTIEHVPRELITSQTNTKDNMSMTLFNGSTLTVVGANANPESIRGQNTKLYILSEFVDISPGVLGIIRPIVAANGGQIIIESTVKQDGVSGGTFLRLYDAAEKDPTQLAMRVLATEYMSQAQLDQVRQDYIDEYGNDFLFRQEFLLDEGAALATSYYGNALTRMKDNGRIGLHSYNDKYPVYTSWDLGMADSTAVLFWQFYDGKVYIIDSYETHDIGDESIVRFVQTKPYNYGWHFLPHDGAKRDSDAISRIQKIRGYGLSNASLLTRRSKEDGIKRAVEWFNSLNTFINQPMTTDFISKIRLYKRKHNEFTGDYEGPEHKSESHYADALRYLFEAIDQAFDPKTHEFFYSEKEEYHAPEQLISSMGGDYEGYYDDGYDF